MHPPEVCDESESAQSRSLGGVMKVIPIDIFQIGIRQIIDVG